VNSSTNQQLKLLVNIDDESDSSFQSFNDISSGYATILVNGIFRITTRTIVNVHLKTHSQLAMLKGSNVRFRLLSGTGFTEAFSLRMTPAVWRYKLNRLKNVSFQIWSGAETRGSFVNTDLVVASNGYFVAGSNSIYMMIANIILVSEENRSCMNSIIFKVNDNKIAAIHNETTQTIETVTINVLRYLKLTKNDRLWLELASTCDKVRVHYQSTFSVCQFHESTKGFSSTNDREFSVTSIDDLDWFPVNLENFNKSFYVGDFEENNDAIAVSTIFIRTKMAGVILVSIATRILIANDLPQNLILAITRNKIPENKENITKQADVFSAQKVSKERADEINLQLSAEFIVKTDDVLTVKVFRPQLGRWLFEKNSQYISVVYLQVADKLELPINGAFHLTKSWRILELCDFNSDYIVLYANGSIGIRENGVYFISVDFQVDKKVEKSDIELALKLSDGIERRTVLYASEREVDYTKTFKIASSLRLHTTHTLGVHVKANNVQTIKASCARFQIHFIGDHYSVVGFQANLKNDFVVNGNGGYFSIRNFLNIANSTNQNTFYYNTAEGFDYDRGAFKAPVKGIYMLSVNVVIKDVIMTSSLNYAALMVKINKKDSAFFKLKQHKAVHKGESGVRSSTVSFSANGAVELKEHDEVTLEVYVNSDERWSVDARSSFSIFLVGQQPNGFLMYRPSIKLEKEIQDSDAKTISGFKTSRFPPPYGMFAGATVDIPTMQDTKTIMFAKDGTYIVSLNLLLNRQGADKVVTLKLVKDNTTNNVQQEEIRCDTLTTSFQVLSTSCTIVKRFRRGDICTIQIASSNGVFDNKDFYNEQSSDQNMAYISVVILGKAVNFQAGLVNLKVRQPNELQIDRDMT